MLLSDTERVVLDDVIRNSPTGVADIANRLEKKRIAPGDVQQAVSNLVEKNELLVDGDWQLIPNTCERVA